MEKVEKAPTDAISTCNRRAIAFGATAKSREKQAKEQAPGSSGRTGDISCVY